MENKSFPIAINIIVSALIGAIIATIAVFALKPLMVRKLDQKAVQRVVSRDLIPSPTPTIVTRDIPVVDPSVRQQLDDLKKEVQSLP